MENPEPTNESILKPKAKRTLTDEQRLVLANRMRAVNDKRIADAMAKKAAAQPAPPVETPKVEKKKRIVRVVEISENEESESESEEEIIIVPKKKPVKAAQPKPEVKQKPKPKKKPQPVYEESEEEEAPKPITKPKKQVSQPVPEAPKILYRFL
jgi:hypothetical protein